VYLTTDSGERKTTGSYYTPEYVVEYIVENTLGPLVTEIREGLVALSARGDQGFAAEFADRVFDLKVLDPAMGSGHFLTNAVDYLAREIIDAQEKQAAQQGIETVDEQRDINWARRQVAQRCIYGVDLNPLAVELAKVSLWLRTLAAEQPLAFLDHHLKTGNSLVGSDIETVLDNGDPDNETEEGQLTLQQSFNRTRRQALEHVTDQFEDLLAIDNETLDDIKEMEAVYEGVRDDPLYQHLIAMANVHTAEQFGLDVPADAYERMAEALRDDSWTDIEGQDWYLSAQVMAKDQLFFHWELEFPIAFYEQNGERKEDGGFDAVIGNPPYRSLALGSGQESESKEYLKYLRLKYPEASDYKSNIYPMFLDIGTDLVRQKSFVSMIVPNTILTNTSYTSIREKLLINNNFVSIVESNITVFSEVETGGVTIPVLSKETNVEDTETDIIELKKGKEFEKKGSIQQDIILRIPDNRILTTPKKVDLLRRLPQEKECLGDISTFYQGIITGDNNKFLSNEKKTEEHHKVVRGRDVHRYYIDWGGTYILFDEHELWSNTDREEFEKSPKIIIRQTADELICAVDEERMFSLDSTILIHPELSCKYISALLNSSLLNWYYRTLVPEEGEAFCQVKITNISKLPIVASETEEMKNIETKYDDIVEYKREKEALNLNLLDYLGISSDKLPDSKVGKRLEDLQMPVAGVADTPLIKTTEDYEGLRIEGVTFVDDGGRLVLSVDISYKLDEDDPRETDRWDRLAESEFETYEAMAFVGLTEAEETLLREFIPVAVEKAEGFAGFRQGATKTNSPLDRLKDLTLPDIDEVQTGLEQYIEVRERADELEEKIEKTDQLIDEIVYDLYELTDEEIEIVESAVQDD
jgi:hypothetical protein